MPNHQFEKLIVVSSSATLLNCEKLENGSQYYYLLNSKEGKKILKEISIQDIDGIVYYLDKAVGLKGIINKLDFFYQGREKIDGLEVYYGYDSSYQDFRIIEGKKINVQIVENSTNIIVGYPMILCGY